jgi:NADH-quinone oxidoreductase subunit N
VFLSAFEPLRADWVPICWAIAIVTMIVGTVVGVVQTNIKRMLAYSSIAHAGYLLVGIVAFSDIGKAAVLFYLFIYSLTNLGAFGVLAVLGRDDLRDYTGLWRTRPALAALLTVFLLSLGGFPPTAGFIAKWYIFNAAVGAGYYGLAIIGVITSVVSVFFYLRVVVMMYMSEPAVEPMIPAVSTAAIVALALPTIAILYLGILPAPLIDLAAGSIATIF